MGEGMVFRTLCHFRPLLNMFGTLRTLRTNNINEWNIKIGPLGAPCTIIVIHCALCNNHHIFSSPSSSILTVPLKSRWGDFLGLPPKPPATRQCNHWFDIVTIQPFAIINCPAQYPYSITPYLVIAMYAGRGFLWCRKKIPWVGTKVQNIIKYF